MSTLKNCLHCGISFVGRTDKRYCSTVCKSRDFREHGGARTTVVINHVTAEQTPPAKSPSSRVPTRSHPARQREMPPVPMLPITPELPVSTSDLPPPPPIKPLREQVVDSVAQIMARRNEEAMNLGYRQQIETFLNDEGQALRLTALITMKSNISSLISRYREHPLVKQGSELHRKRLDDLYIVQDAISDALTTAQEQPFWRDKVGGYQLSEKVRRKMRDRLIG